MFLLLQGVLLNNVAVNRSVSVEKLNVSVVAGLTVGLIHSLYLSCFWLILKSILIS